MGKSIKLRKKRNIRSLRICTIPNINIIKKSIKIQKFKKKIKIRF
jgi:hypothetical protein